MHRDAAIDGLRERKKRETRSALAWAAVRLAAERGFANVPVEDIAAGAGVSPRTFNNYFSSKAEAIVARHVDRLQAIAAELRARPPEEELWAAIGEAVVTQLSWRGGGRQPAPPAVVRRGQADGGGAGGPGGVPAPESHRRKRHRRGDHRRIGAARTRSTPIWSRRRSARSIQVSLEQWLRAPQVRSLRQIMQTAFERMGRIADVSTSTSSASSLAEHPRTLQQK